MKYQCYVRSAKSEFVHTITAMLSMFSYVQIVMILKLTPIVIILLGEKANKVNGYNKLTESPMSLLLILRMLFWDGYGK